MLLRILAYSKSTAATCTLTSWAMINGGNNHYMTVIIEVMMLSVMIIIMIMMMIMMMIVQVELVL